MPPSVAAVSEFCPTAVPDSRIHHPSKQEDPVNNQPTIEVDPATAASVGEPATAAAEQLVEETLVEEVSIDGMCGVY